MIVLKVTIQVSRTIYKLNSFTFYRAFLCNEECFLFLSKIKMKFILQ